MFALVIRFDPAAAALLTRLVNVLEASQQSQVDALTQRLKTSGDKLESAVDANSPTE